MRYDVILDILNKVPDYGYGTPKASMKRIKNFMHDLEYDDDFIENINDDFCRGFGTARNIISKLLSEEYWETRKLEQISEGDFMKLKDTVELMNSSDYRERFVAEYRQLVIRYKGLENMIEKWNTGDLTFEPTCPRSTYDLQLRAMKDYIAVLEARAVMEGIEL